MKLIDMESYDHGGSDYMAVRGSRGKESACNAGDPGSILGSGRSPGGGNGNPLQCSCLENPRDCGARVHRLPGVVCASRMCAQ